MITPMSCWLLHCVVCGNPFGGESAWHFPDETAAIVQANQSGWFASPVIEVALCHDHPWRESGPGGFAVVRRYDMIKTRECVVLACDACGEPYVDFEHEGAIHFPTAEAAMAFVASAGDDLWQVIGSLMFCCYTDECRAAADAARPHHIPVIEGQADLLDALPPVKP